MELLYFYYYLAGINILTTFLFTWDKFKSIFTFTTRISENTFHTLELLGGCFSTLILINLINHKSAKLSFKLISYSILTIWIFLLYKFKDYLFPFLKLYF